MLVKVCIRVAIGLAVACSVTACDGFDGRPAGEGDRKKGGGGGSDPGDAEYRQGLIDDLRVRVTDAGISPTPPAPPVSAEMFDLGRALAFDKILSGNQNISCMTCHHPDLSTDDDRSLPAGEGGVGLGADRVGGAIIPRNAPALFNLHTFGTMFWDSRVEPAGDGTIATPAGSQVTPDMQGALTFGLPAAQAMFPVTSREEMRGEGESNEIAEVADSDFQGIWAALMVRLGEIPEYVAMFEDAYGQPFDQLTFAHAANAIAAFEIAAFEARSSKWEQFVGGDDEAMTTAQLEGALQFFDSGCIDCHNGPGLSDFQHHNTGLAQFGPGKTPSGDDPGRFLVTGDPDDMYRFRTPILTNVELTGPWGHDGQFVDMSDFLNHYADIDGQLTEYVIEENVTQQELWPLVFDNVDEVLSQSNLMDDRTFAGNRKARNAEIAKIQAFMGALVDESWRGLGDVVPTEVPSGLPVLD